MRILGSSGAGAEAPSPRAEVLQTTNGVMSLLPLRVGYWKCSVDGHSTW